MHDIIYRSLRTFILPILLLAPVKADIPLIGNDFPGKSVNDGDFDWVTRAPWRKYLQSPRWTSHIIKGEKAGLSAGFMSSGGCGEVYFDSVELTENTDYSKLVAGDILSWKFASMAQYTCNPRVSFSLLFGDKERPLVVEQEVPGGNVDFKTFEGTYTITEEDAAQDRLKARLTAFDDFKINVYFDYIDLKVLRDETAGPRVLKIDGSDAGPMLTWSQTGEDDRYNVYRSGDQRKNYMRIAENVSETSFTDTQIISGQTSFYFVTRAGEIESKASPIVLGRKVDNVPPAPPRQVTAKGQDFLVKLSWKKADKDTASYKVFRRIAGSEKMELIAPHVKGTSYLDNLPYKGVDNSYAVQAVDFSGNKGELSERVTARVKIVPGASFSDVILPMPIHKELRSDLWGAEGVLPRDPDNGVEDEDWSYWGGKVIKEQSDGKYHILIVRWPESDRKGHWAWPYSTVAHAVSDKPTGPFKIIKDLAYEYANGLGHNANIISLKDGTYALYSSIAWDAMIFKSETMNGPWKVLGEMKVNIPENFKNPHRLERNLSGVHCKDGSFLFATKAGGTMRSTNGLLGPYEVTSGPMAENQTIPEALRKSNYEDPVLWYDGVQYHMIINAFLEYRAIYLRSPDGVNWKFEDGFAYTPLSTTYEDGTRTLWYKTERPNVLQDQYGRATHLSLAVLDVPKRQDFDNDQHGSKHIIIPLNTYKRIEMLNEEPVIAETKHIRVRIRSEKGFDAKTDIDLDSLRFGASQEVNFGGGSRVISSSVQGADLIVEFDGTGNGITKENFVCKLIGRTTKSGLIVGYSKLVAE